MVSGKQILQLFVSILVICGLAYVCYAGYRYWQANQVPHIRSTNSIEQLVKEYSGFEPFTCKSVSADFTSAGTEYLWWGHGKARYEIIVPADNTDLNYIIDGDMIYEWERNGSAVYTDSVTAADAVVQQNGTEMDLDVPPPISSDATCAPLWNVDSNLFKPPLNLPITPMRAGVR